MAMRNLWLRSLVELGNVNTILRLLCLMVITTTLNACSVAYYKPSYPDNTATPVQDFCGTPGKLRVPTVLRLTIPDGHIDVALSGSRQGQLQLWMCIATAESSTLQFTSNVIRRTDLDIGRELATEAKYLFLTTPLLMDRYIRYTENIDLIKILPTAREHILNKQTVWIPFSLKDFSPDAIRVHLPPIVVGSEEYRIPSLLWEADKEGREIEGYKKSWGWWPYTVNVVKAGSFDIHAGVTGGLHGSSKVDVRLKVPELKGNIMVDFPVDMKWRFSANEIQFEDISSGDIREINFTQLENMSSSIVINFTAPFSHTREATLSGRLDWWSALPIGEERAKKVRIEIPPILINGKEFIIKPITFDIGHT